MADKNVIVMGDMNDTPTTPVINRLRGFDDIWGDFLQTANAVEVDRIGIRTSTKVRKICLITSSSVQVYGLSFAMLRRENSVKLLMSVNYRITAQCLHGCGLSILLLCLRQTKVRFEMELYPDVAPKTVANFIKLVEMDFYDGLTFHRYEENFVIQGGDPEGSGSGGPGWTIPGEFQNPKAPCEDASTQKRGGRYGADAQTGFRRQPILHLFRRKAISLF